MRSPRETRVDVSWASMLWKAQPSFPRTPATAAVAKAVLDKLAAERGGSFKPADVVEVARPLESALHGAFEWHDDVAAELWRLEQARELTHGLRQTVVVVYDDEEEHRGTDCPVFVSYRLDDEPARRYRSVEVTLQRQDTRLAMLAEAKAELERFRRRYDLLVELEPVITEIERLLAAPDSDK